MSRFTLTCVAVAALTLSSGAMAQGYLGFGAGSTKLDASCAGTTACDNSGTGFKVYGGYRVGPNWSVEGGYYDFGKASASADSGEGIASVEIKTTGFGVGVAFLSDLASDWTFAARIGVASVKADVTGSLGGLTAADSETTTQAYYGLSLGYRINKNLVVDLAYDGSKSSYGGESGNVGLLSLGLNFAF
jgi:OOP family OmpA-OmpF porin